MAKKLSDALQESQDITLIENTFDNIIEMTDEELDKALLDNADFIVKWCDKMEEITKQHFKNGVLKVMNNFEEKFDGKIFKVGTKNVLTKNGPFTASTVVSPDWVQVIPITTDRKVVMVKQKRFGVEEEFLEFPGGIIDIEDKDPYEAGLREVLEETGYSTNLTKPDFEMSVYANPAFMNNKMHNFIVHNFFKKDSQKLDENEDVEIVLYDLDEILNPLSQFEQKLKHAYAKMNFLWLKDCFAKGII